LGGLDTITNQLFTGVSTGQGDEGKASSDESIKTGLLDNMSVTELVEKMLTWSWTRLQNMIHKFFISKHARHLIGGQGAIVVV